MKNLVISLAFISLTAFAADFQAGLDAYNKGDFATALKEWQPLAEQGDANAEYNIGLLYARGQGVPQDYAKALAWYQKAAEQDVPAAEYNLGVMYANGQGVTANPAEAKKWFLKAEQKGVGEAVEGLAAVYGDNGAVSESPAELEKWYREAAAKGVARAAFNLGVMYDVGQGVQQDYTEALKWYRQAADEGYASAMTNIAILYYNGQGVKRDLVQAYLWWARAQERGDPRAGQMIEMAQEKIDKKKLKTLEAQVNEWQPSAKPRPLTETSEVLFKSAAAAPASASGSVPPPKPAVVTPAVAPPSAPQSSAIPDVWTGIARVVAIGDVHGDYESFAEVLQSAGLIDGNGNWTGGKTHLVQTGDIVDRGPNSRAVMDLLIRLQRQAEAAGGAVHCLLGNHEAMNVYGDLRYVSPAEFASFAAGNSADRGASYEYGKPITAAATPSFDQAQSSSEHPNGFAELRAAFGPEGVYGKWLRSENAVIKIDRTLFVHAGLGSKYADWSIDKINQEVREELADFTRLHGGIVTDTEGPLWYSGLAKGDEKQEPLVDQLLKHFDVDRIVIGHTYAQGAVTPRFGGKVIMIDVGIPRIYDNVSKIACLEIDNGKAYALHRGQKLDLPADDSGNAMLQYLQKAEPLDPKPSPLDSRIASMQKK